MIIDYGDIFYRYSDNYDAEEDIHDVELYVSISRSKKKSDDVLLVNIETEEYFEIKNGDIPGTDLTFLTPDYHFYFGFVKDIEWAGYLICSKGKNNLVFRYVSNETENLFREMNSIKDITRKITGYKFLTLNQIKLIVRLCYGISDENVISELSESIMQYNLNIMDAVDLPKTHLDGVRLKCDIGHELLHDNPDLREFEEAIRWYCSAEHYTLLPLTPAYDLEKITMVYKIVRLSDKNLYILMYQPIESYLDRGIREDPEVSEVYDLMCKNK